MADAMPARPKDATGTATEAAGTAIPPTTPLYHTDAYLQRFEARVESRCRALVARLTDASRERLRA